VSRAAVLGLVACLGLGACGPRGFVTIDAAAFGAGAPVKLLVATTREPVADAAVFSGLRAQQIRYADFVVSVPPDRKPGTIRYPGRYGPDPARDFLTLEARRIPDRARFIAALERSYDAVGIDEATIFVHGFNETFAEALYRQAQMVHDFDMTDAQVNYAWPSEGSYEGYVYDKESVMFAAAGLRDTMAAVAESEPDRIILLAHSMGALLTLEALQQLAIAGDRETFARIHALVMMAPDVDVGMFRAIMREIEPYGIRVFIFSSTKDKALRAAARIQGGVPRLGEITDPAEFADLPVTLINISDFATPDSLDHETAMTSPTLMGLFRGMSTIGQDVMADTKDAPNLVESTLATVGDATGLDLSPGRP
jgi:esterase/lipase superfamily enzyme